jgi:hypothetical protein
MLFDINNIFFFSCSPHDNNLVSEFLVFEIFENVKHIMKG